MTRALRFAAKFSARFTWNGKRVEPGELVELPFYLAVDAQSVGKVRIVE